MTWEPRPSTATKPLFPPSELCGRKTLRLPVCGGGEEWEVVRKGFGGGDSQADGE